VLQTVYCAVDAGMPPKQHEQTTKVQDFTNNTHDNTSRSHGPIALLRTRAQEFLALQLGQKPV